MKMDKKKKTARYERLYEQIAALLEKSTNTLAHKATIIAVLHHKMEYFFWTGFYMLADNELIVEMYQGPVACQVLPKDQGVCWAAIQQHETIIVKNTEKFSGHIACDSRSRSEIVVPLKNSSDKIVGVLDIDSKELASFDETDALWLEKIVGLL